MKIGRNEPKRKWIAFQPLSFKFQGRKMLVLGTIYLNHPAFFHFWREHSTKANEQCSWCLFVAILSFQIFSNRYCRYFMAFTNYIYDYMNILHLQGFTRFTLKNFAKVSPCPTRLKRCGILPRIRNLFRKQSWWKWRQSLNDGCKKIIPISHHAIPI